MSTSNPLNQTINEAAGGYATGTENSADKASAEVDIVEQKLAEDAQKEDFTDIDSAHSGQLLKMSMTLGVNEGFMLLFAEYNNLNYQSKVINWLDKKLVDQAVLDCEDIPDYALVEEQLFQLAKNHQVIHITGTHRWFSKNATENWADRLNYRRERIAENAPVAIVLWLFGSQITELAKQATDFWTWRTSTFEFNNVPKSMGMEANFDLFRVMDFNILDKEARVTEINNYLESVIKPALSEVDLYIELTKLYLSLYELNDIHNQPVNLEGYLNKAEKNIDKAFSIVESTDDLKRTALTYKVKAELHTRRKEYGTAKAILAEQVIPVFTELMDQVSLAEAKFELAEALHANNQPKRAIKLLQEEVIPVFRSLDENRNLERSYLALVSGYIAADDDVKAAEIMEEAWVYQRQFGTSAISTAVYLLYAVNKLKAGDLNQAKLYIEEHVIPGFTYFEFPDIISQVAYDTYVTCLGELEQYSSAITILENKCIPLFKNNNNIEKWIQAVGGVLDFTTLLARKKDQTYLKKSYQKNTRVLNELYRFVISDNSNIEWKIQIEDMANEYGIKLHPDNPDDEQKA